MITPFKQDMSLDEEALKQLVLRQVESGITGIAPLGVTGENTLMTDEEVAKVLKITVDNAKGKSLIVPDICAMSLWKGLERVKQFADMGADYIVAYSPFFVLPKVDGMIDFFEKLADASPVPIIMHNAKGRTGIEMTPEITAHLAKHPNIIGIKDGNKQTDHLAKVIYLTKDDDFDVYTGKDTTAFPFIASGGSGTFTVAGNVIPEVMQEMVDFSLNGQIEEARKIHFSYYPLFEAFRFETNPMGAKKALELMGLINGALRPPLTSLSKGKTEIMKSILEERGLV